LLFPFARFARLAIGRANHCRDAFIDRRVQPRPGGFTNTSTGFKPTQQFDETWGQWLHEIVLFPQRLSELGSDSPVITAVSEVAGGLTSAVPSLFHERYSLRGLDK
jgi:hypothetical protein